MNRIAKISIAFVLMFALFTGSFSLLQVKGVYTGYAQSMSGLGAGIDFPLIPMFPTTIYITKTADKSLNLNFTFDGKTFSGAKNVGALTIEGQLGLPLPEMAGWSFGVNGVLDLLTINDAANSAIAFPGFIYGGVYGKYKQNLMPLVDLFGELGFMTKFFNAQDEVNKKITAGSFDMSSLDKSGLYYRAGVSIGF